MRFLIRLIVLALAAVGAKALYDKLAPHRDELRRTGTDFVARTTSATHEVVGKATEAAQRIASTAQDGAGSVKETAVAQGNEVKSAVRDAGKEALDALGSHDADGSSPAAGVSTADL